MCWRILVPHNLLSYDFINLILSDIQILSFGPNQNSNLKCFIDKQRIMGLFVVMKVTLIKTPLL